MRRIAVDAMGGDSAPRPEVEGAILAVRERSLEVILVGDEVRVRAELSRLGVREGDRLGPGRLRVHHASQVITMEDSPGQAFKTKKDSSMRVCFNLASQGEADAVVSAGNSGAMLACGLFLMKRLPGLERPGIVTLAPTHDGSYCVALDVGANTEVKPQVLVQFAVLGAAYARVVLGKTRPRVAVLSNGEEDSKGTDVTRQAWRVLHAADTTDFTFAGYAEGRDFFPGRLDVVVTDGWTGNIALKTFEGGLELVFELLRQEARRSLRTKLGGLLLKPALRALRRRIEPEEHGGAPLLGLDGVAVIAHGRATAKAMKNAIFAADRLVGAGLRPALAEAIARHRQLWTEDDASQPGADGAAPNAR